MFCKNCGNEINDGERFCGKCGTPVDAADAVGKESAEKSFATTVVQATGTPASKDLAKIIATASAAAAILQLILWFVKCVTGTSYGYEVGKFSMSGLCSGFGVILTIITFLLCLASAATSALPFMTNDPKTSMPLFPIVTGAWCLLLFIIKVPGAFEAELAELGGLSSLITIEKSLTFGGVLYIIVSIALIALGAVTFLKMKKS